MFSAPRKGGFCFMPIRKVVKKEPVKGKVEKPLKEEICSECGKKRSYSNKTKKLCAVCVKKSQIAKIKEKKAKVRQKKAISTSVLIKKLDALYSVYIRLKAIEKDGYVKCFTCDRVEYWRKIQNGHFQSRRFLSTRFYDFNCAPQCYACNVGLSGMQYEYGIRLDKKYGEGTAQHVVELSKEFRKFNSDELLKMIDETEQKIQFLRKLKDIWD
jgi:hypothetical protein